MTSRSARPLAALAILALAVPAAAEAKSKAKPKPATTTLPATKVHITKIGVADGGGPPHTLGDMQVFSFTTSAANGAAGSGHGYCVRTEPGVAALCTAVANFKNGTIVTTWEARDGDLTNPIHVTGGSGAYFGVHGAGVIAQDSASDPLSYTITLKVKS